MFLLLLAPGAGDDLQGIKRGIVELADLIVVNKADGDLAAAAERARRDYASALHMLRPASALWTPKVIKCSAATGAGIDDVWTEITAYRAAPGMEDDIASRRRHQARAWMWSEVHETLVARLAEARRVGDLVEDREAAVAAGESTPSEAARAILDAFLGRRSENSAGEGDDEPE